MTFGLIIFDCDGVLIDGEIIACRTDSACLAEIGIAIIMNIARNSDGGASTAFSRIRRISARAAACSGSAGGGIVAEPAWSGGSRSATSATRQLGV